MPTSEPEIDTEKLTITPAENALDEEIKNEVSVHELLETPNQTNVVVVPELHHGPEYDLDWSFIDKDTIRVTFDLFSLPQSLLPKSKNSTDLNDNKFTLVASMVTFPSRSIKSIFALQYFLFIIRPYKSNKEIILKMERLHLKESPSTKYSHYSNSLRLTSLHHKEKYTVCICYYRNNISTQTPALILCQDIINDYSKFSHLRTNPTHGLLFITTQYSIIIALLALLQGTLTLRKRRIAHIIGQHIATTAHSIRTTLSSVSLVRQSFSSLDAAGEQQHHHHHHHHHNHAHNGQATHREPPIKEEGGAHKRIISSPAIIISEPVTPLHHGASSSDEIEPFLPRIASKNHVHFLLGPGEGSDDDEHEENPLDSTSDVTTTTNINREPYGDQSDALLCMAHILDTNKPWSRHSHDPSLV